MSIKYLALGDSYTIGEKVEFLENFPNQLATSLNNQGKNCELPKIIAVTGWTTDELSIAIEKERPGTDYDFVTLLIGVNNQYRGRSLEEYSWQFYSLLCQAILYAKGESQRVLVLSIPDWGLTPFNKERDKKITSNEIDSFNQINEEITRAMNCRYIDITQSTRNHAIDLSYLAEDQLHYSAKEYAVWVAMINKQFGE
jgi:lysophospholipase L1-like esterase